MDTGPARVMTLGHLHGPFGTRPHFARRMGATQLEPQWTTRFLNPQPTSPQVPQNLLRATVQNGPRALVAIADPLGNTRKLLGLGDADSGTPSTTELAPPAGNGASPTGYPAMPVLALVATAGAAASAYHGYRRNDVRGGHPLGWALGWALLGWLAPVITIPVALAQGYGKRAR